MRSLSISLSLAAGLFCWLNAAPKAEASEPSFTDAILNAWVADCNAWGNQAECRSTWSVGLSDDHLIQDYSIRHQESGALIFQGRGVYKIADGQVTGFWEDSQGSIHPIHGEITGQTLSVVWGSPATSLGRSTYSVEENGFTVRDYGLNEDGWSEFMHVRYFDGAE